jgi:hypothetical protein
MSVRRLRARLDRLAQSASKTTTGENKDLVCEFVIDPALANALRNDRKRVDELEKSKTWDLRKTQSEEERLLCARIAENAKKISCPAGYGFKESWDDKIRLSALRSGEVARWFAHIKLYDVQDIDVDVVEAQVVARIEAFKHSPEGYARKRIDSLHHNDELTVEEEGELYRLLALYPEPHGHPDDPIASAIHAGREAMIRYKVERRERRKIEDENRLKRKRLRQNDD